MQIAIPFADNRAVPTVGCGKRHLIADWCAECEMGAFLPKCAPRNVRAGDRVRVIDLGGHYWGTWAGTEGTALTDAHPDRPLVNVALDFGHPLVHESSQARFDEDRLRSPGCWALKVHAAALMTILPT